MAASENISSDILQQALENSGLTNPTDQPTDAAGRPGRPVAMLRIHDAATGTVKKHVIRKVC